MLRAKRKKRKGKREKKIKKKCIDERETLSYEQEILDNNRQLARLRSRNEELEEKAELVMEKFHQLEADRSDIMAHLKRNLEEKIEETKELSEQLSALEETRKEELASFKKKQEAMELEYRTMENNLSAEVKLVAGKLNALEDWRLARLDLMQKFENQEKEILEQEHRHKETLYEAEKSVVIGKAMMKKEMEEHLRMLAETLCKATNLRVADATHRAVRENVSLQQEFNEILQACKEQEATNREYNEGEKISKLQCELLEAESKICLNKTIEQRKTIHNLVNDFQSLMSYYGRIDRDNIRITEYERIAEDFKQKNEQMEQKIRLLERCVLKVRKDKGQLIEEIQEREKELNMLKNILSTARSCIKEALQLKGDTLNKNCCTEHLKNKLLHCLWEILDDENITNALGHTASQIEDVQYPYMEGCLCLIKPLKKKQNEKSGLKNQKERDSKKDAEDIVSWESIDEKLESCVLSDISSNIPSPKESITDSEL